MTYHKVDERWPIFGCKDYESYLNKYLVKGLFHEGVPKDVKESYTVVEFLIAHAWYHYPMYDEALNKALRIFELSIKKKCAILSISIYKSNNKEKRLINLIDEVCKHESNKRQNVFLNFLRELRNLLMHPSENYFGGGIMFGKIQLVVNVINILFAPESFIISLDLLSAKRQKDISFLYSKSMAIFSDEKAILIHNIHLGDVFIRDTEEIILLFVEPVCKFSDEQKEKQVFPNQILYEILNPIITSDRITGIDLNTGFDITIMLATEELDLQAARNFQEYLYNIKVEPHNFSPYLTSNMNEIGNGLQKFRYKYYHSIKINS